MFLSRVCTAARNATALRGTLLPSLTVSNFRNVGLRWSSGGGRDIHEIEHHVIAILKCFDKIDPKKLTLDSHLIKDLGLDSLDTVECVMAIEDELSVEFPDDVAETLFTPRDAVKAVMRVQAGPSQLKSEDDHHDAHHDSHAHH